MGHSDQLAKRKFAEETERVTGGALAWQDPPEIGLVKVQADGLLVVRRPELLASLPPPWLQAQGHDEILVELKMAGDHVDVQALERALLRRQARQVQRVEQSKPLWLGQEPLWWVSPHMPGWLRPLRRLHKVAPGCYRVLPSGFPFLWIAANKLPLRDELVPFLVARSGKALDEFILWVASRRPLEWLADVVRYTPMSTIAREELIRRFAKAEDPVVEARTREFARMLLDALPDVRKEEVDKGRLTEARTALRRVLARRQLALTPDEDARIDACTDLATLERWHDQAITAASAIEALQ